MYSILVKAVAGPELDIAKARLYANGEDVKDIPVAPGAEFQGSITVPASGPVTIGYSFVDKDGNESPVRSQIVTVPDKDAPAAPTKDLQVVSIVWVQQ